MSMFKRGDKVRLVRDGMFGWELEPFTERQLVIGNVYTVRETDNHYLGGFPAIMLEEPQAYYHPDHFILFSIPTNAERIERRKSTMVDK